MSYISSAKLYCQFESTTVIDSVTGTTFTVTGSAPTLATGRFGNALQLSESTSISSSQSISLTTTFTTGFWLKPQSPGLTLDHSNLIGPLRMPVYSKAVGVTNLFTGDESVSRGQFAIWEETQGNGQNTLNVYVIGGASGPYSTTTSEAYNAGEFHHFWVAYNGASTTVSIFIDGRQSATTVAGSTPTTLDTFTTSVQINAVTVGQGYNIAHNTGVLDELFLLDTYDVNQSDVARVMRFGAAYLIDSSLVNVDEVTGAGITNDTGTTQVNAVVTDHANLYVGRSDGKLLRGRIGVWQFNQSDSSQPTEMIRV